MFGRRGTEAAPKSHHYLMLLALLGGDAHGLGIAREVERLSEGRVRLWPATLYGSLEELQELGFIEELRTRRPAEGRRGTQAHLPDHRPGPEVARGETRRLADLVKVAQSRAKARGETA